MRSAAGGFSDALALPEFSDIWGELCGPDSFGLRDAGDWPHGVVSEPSRGMVTAKWWADGVVKKTWSVSTPGSEVVVDGLVPGGGVIVVCRGSGAVYGDTATVLRLGDGASVCATVHINLSDAQTLHMSKSCMQCLPQLCLTPTQPEEMGALTACGSESQRLCTEVVLPPSGL